MINLFSFFLLSLALIQVNVPESIIVELNQRLPSTSEKGITDTDSLPYVFTDRMDILDLTLRTEAATWFTVHQLPKIREEWETQQIHLRDAIAEGAKIENVDSALPFNVQLTGTITADGYVIKNIAFQTLPDVYATANIYVPEGEGPFPAVLTMMGHWESGKLAGQEIGHTLALNGYVALIIDPWGAGERTTSFNEFEYHGGNLGASLMNVGRSLLGIQVSENMRAVDLLISLPYVDSDNIGATGASGGGNQTMWLTALDERIKAAVPVVSVGTFDSYVLGHNCICEVLIDGLTHTEASGVLALIAPRALKMHNHTKESNPAFFPEAMLRSYKNARLIYGLYDADDNISYDLFDLTHGYYQENREGMLGWFDLHLKGTANGSPKKEIPFENIPEVELMVYPDERFDGVLSTAKYNIEQGRALRSHFLNTLEYDSALKKNELQKILRINEKSTLSQIHQYSTIKGWDRFSLKTTNNTIKKDDVK